MADGSAAAVVVVVAAAAEVQRCSSADDGRFCFEEAELRPEPPMKAVVMRGGPTRLLSLVFLGCTADSHLVCQRSHHLHAHLICMLNPLA